MDRTDTIRAQFGVAALRYAESPIHRGGPDLEAMLEAAALTGVERALDLGCGPGHAALALARGAGSVVGVDLSSAMLDQARELAVARAANNVRFQRADAQSLPFEAEAFDLVTSRFSAHHYADPRAVVAEVARVLAPGGRFLLVDSVAPEDPAQDTFLNAIELLRDPSHVRNHRVAEWRAWLEEAGLRSEQRGAWKLPIDFESWLARIGTPSAAADQLRVMLRQAPDEVRKVFRVSEPGECDWAIPVALIAGCQPTGMRTT